jgi:hypothetical protein
MRAAFHPRSSPRACFAGTCARCSGWTIMSSIIEMLRNGRDAATETLSRSAPPRALMTVNGHTGHRERDQLSVGRDQSLNFWNKLRHRGLWECCSERVHPHSIRRRVFTLSGVFCAVCDSQGDFSAPYLNSTPETHAAVLFSFPRRVEQLRGRSRRRIYGLLRGTTPCQADRARTGSGRRTGQCRDHRHGRRSTAFRNSVAGTQ